MHIGTSRPERRRRKPPTLLRRFARADTGATVIEFALVGPIFFALLGATLETALTFFAAYALDTAVIDSSRSIKTLQPGFSYSAETYRDALCARLYNMFDCEEIRISVTGGTSFGAIPQSSPIDPNSGAWSFFQTYGAVGGGPIAPDSTVMIEAYYKWPTIFNIPGLQAGQTPDGKRLLAAAHVFKTEPGAQ